MNIKERRENKGLLQRDLAIDLGVDRSTIAKWESGKTMPSVSMLFRLAKLFGCTIDELFRDVDNPTAERDSV